MSRIPPHGARIVGAWPRNEAPQRQRPRRAEQAEPVESVEMAAAPMPLRSRHPHLASLGRRLRIVH